MTTPEPLDQRVSDEDLALFKKDVDGPCESHITDGPLSADACGWVVYDLIAARAEIRSLRARVSAPSLPAPRDLAPRVRELEAALRYAARMLDPVEHDVAYILDTLKGGPDAPIPAPLEWTPLKVGQIIQAGDECYGNNEGPWQPVGEQTIGRPYRPWNGTSGIHTAMRRPIPPPKEQSPEVQK